jgi:hypothetical protein
LQLLCTAFDAKQYGKKYAPSGEEWENKVQITENIGTNMYKYA